MKKTRFKVCKLARCTASLGAAMLNFAAIGFNGLPKRGWKSSDVAWDTHAKECIESNDKRGLPDHVLWAMKRVFLSSHTKKNSALIDYWSIIAVSVGFCHEICAFATACAVILHRRRAALVSWHGEVWLFHGLYAPHCKTLAARWVAEGMRAVEETSDNLRMI